MAILLEQALMRKTVILSFLVLITFQTRLWSFVTRIFVQISFFSSMLVLSGALTSTNASRRSVTFRKIPSRASIIGGKACCELLLTLPRQHHIFEVFSLDVGQFGLGQRRVLLILIILASQILTTRSGAFFFFSHNLRHQIQIVTLLQMPPSCLIVRLVTMTAAHLLLSQLIFHFLPLQIMIICCLFGDLLIGFSIWGENVVGGWLALVMQRINFRRRTRFWQNLAPFLLKHFLYLNTFGFQS